MTPDQIAQARQMRDSGMSWKKIAKHFGVSEDTARRPLDPEWTARRNATVAANRRLRRARMAEGEACPSFVHYVCSMPEEAKRDGERLLAQVPADTRDLTGRICGDPLPTRSALDRKLMEAGHAR